LAWLSGWSKRIKITIDCTNIDSDKTWFPVTIFLGASVGQTPNDVTAIFDEVGANRKKIAVTKDDGTTELYVEIEQWDSVAEEAVLHVSLDGWVVTSAVNTEIYIYYDNTHADNNARVGDIGARTEVWDTNFKMVQHMVDTTTSTITDSTSSNNDGTKAAANEPIEAEAKVGRGQQFDGSNDLINTTDLDLTGGATVEAWAELDSTHSDNYCKLVCKGSPEVYQLYYWSGNPGGYTFDIRIGAVVHHVTSDITEEDIEKHFAGTYDGETMTMVVDGVSLNTNATPSGDIDTNDDVLVIGNRKTDARHWKGLIDEVRISDIARSVSWLKATYYSTKDDLLTFGSEELAGQPFALRRRGRYIPSLGGYS